MSQEETTGLRVPEGLDDAFTAPIDDYLMAVAEGVHSAQRKLGRMSVDMQPGQPGIVYELPRVDFELTMSFGWSADQSREAGATQRRLMGSLLGTGSSEAELQAASVIKGSFLASPAQGGKSAPKVTFDHQHLGGGLYRIDVRFQDPVGQSLEGEEVQFNVDWALTDELNGDADAGGNPLDSLRDRVSLQRGVVVSNADGIASNTLSVSVESEGRLYVAVVIDVRGQTEVLTFAADGGSAETDGAGTDEAGGQAP